MTSFSLRLVMGLGAAALATGCQQDRASEALTVDSPRSTKVTARLAAEQGQPVQGAIVVDFVDGTTAEQIDAWEQDWGVDLELNSIEGESSGIALAVGVDDPAAALEKIRGRAEVESAEPLYEYAVPEGEEATWESQSAPLDAPTGQGFEPNDPDFGRQWNLRQIRMPTAWERSRGKGVVVAILDTGIAYEDADGFKQVPDLKGARFAKGYDFVNDDEHANDDHGHGTHVAGTVAQATNNKEGVAGVAFEASLMPVKVLDHFGRGTSADIADAIRFAADHGANVINMSLGGGLYSQVMANAVAYARKKGTTVICAAGNTGQGHVSYPAAYPGAVAVAAVGPEGARAPYSSWGKELDISAPGGDKSRGEQFGILQNTIDPRDATRSVYAFYQGTSMATPHVAGLAALLYAAGAKTPDAVEKALYEGAQRVGGQAWSDQYGHGIIDADRSLKIVSGDATETVATAGVAGPTETNWAPLVWASGLLATVLLTIKKRVRPGYLNVILAPAFLVPLILSTVGLFFVPWLFGGGGAFVEVSSIPIPDWQRIIFGRGRLANPLFYSALIPALISLIGIRKKGLRPVVGGLAIGFAGFLAYAALVHAPALSWLPFTFLAIPWLVVNAIICMVVARAMLRREAV